MRIQTMPYKLVKSQGGYFVVSPHGHYLSKHPLSQADAMKQETAVRLTELRKEHRIPERVMKGEHQHHTHSMKEVEDGGQKEVKTDAEGMVFVPVSRDMVHKHQIISTENIFAPLPLPAHFLHKKLSYASHG